MRPSAQVRKTLGAVSLSAGKTKSSSALGSGSGESGAGFGSSSASSFVADSFSSLTAGSAGAACSGSGSGAAGSAGAADDSPGRDPSSATSAESGFARLERLSTRLSASSSEAANLRLPDFGAGGAGAGVSRFRAMEKISDPVSQAGRVPLWAAAGPPPASATRRPCDAGT